MPNIFKDLGASTPDTDTVSGESRSQGRNIFRDLETQPEAPGMASNAARNLGERGLSLIGNLLQFGGTAAERGEEAITERTGGFNPAVMFGNAEEMAAAGYDPDISLGGFGIDFTSRARPEDTDIGLSRAGQAVEDVDLGYEPRFTIDRALDDPNVASIVGAVAEQGPAALADMAALFANAPAYLGSRTQEIGEARATNERRGEEMPELQDLATAAPFAAGSVLLDRLALGRMLPGGSGAPVRTLRQVPGATGRAAAIEATTEAVQEGGIEYAGETVGTEAGYDPNQAVRRAIGGALIGGPVGGAVRGVTSLSELRQAVRSELEADGQDPNAYSDAEIDRLLAQAEQASEQQRQAPEEVEPGIAERTGTDRPAPVGEGQAPVERRRARREVEREMGQAFDQTDILRREDVEVTEEGVVLREGAQPVRDPTGEQASPETFGARMAARRVADELGLTLSDRDLQLAARDIAADPDADMRQVVRDYSQEGREQAVRVAEARRRRRDENLRQDDLSDEFTPERDFRAGAGRESDLTPRMQQELESVARRVPEGVNVGQPGQPRASVDRISSRQPGGLRGQYQQGQPSPQPEGPAPRQGETFEGEMTAEQQTRQAEGQRQLPPAQQRLPQPEAQTEEEAFLDQYAEGPDLEVETEVSPETQANREATRQTVERLRDRGLITPQHAFRGVTRGELGAIAQTGQLQVGRDAEGRPGISAATVGEGQFPMYGDGAGIIVPPDQVTESGRAAEVLVDENTDPRNLRYVVDGRVVTFDELQQFAETESAAETRTGEQAQPTEETGDGVRQEQAQTQDTETQEEVASDTTDTVERVAPDATQTEGVASDDTQPETERRPGGAQMYAGIPLDRIWDAIKRVTKSEQTEFRYHAEKMGTLIEDAKAASGGVRGKGRATQRSMATDLWRVTLGSLDGDMRVMANGFNSDTLKSIPDLFHATAGQGAGVEQTFDEAVQSRNRRLRDVDQILAYMRDNNISGKQQQEQVIRLVENPKTPRRGAVGEAANRIEKFLKDELAYMREAGVELGEVRDGYFPRQMDTGKASGDPEGFIKAATRAYKKMGLNDKDAREAAKAYWESTVYGVSGKPGEPPRSSQTPNFMKGRVFTKEAANEMRAFRVQDIDAILGQYTMRATRRAEVARRFGDNWSGWSDIENRILEEDPNVQAVLPAIRDRVALSAGINQHGFSHSAQATLSALRTWTTLATLPKAAMASLGELVLAPVRGTTGSIPGDLAQSVVNLWTHMANFSATMAGLGRSEKMTAAFEMAEDIGLIAGVGHNALMAARFAGGDPVGRVQSEVLASFFRRNMLENLTNYTRVTTMLQGQVFMRRLAKQMEKNPKRAGFFLRELGVPKGKEADFAEFVRGFGDRMPMGQELSGEFAATYRNALQRFTDQTVMRPSVSTRPKWTRTPLGAMIFQLQAFGYAFQKNVINRQVRATKELGWVDGAAFSLASMTGIAGLVAVQGLIRYWRDELYDPDINERKTSGAFVEGALSQAGLFGVADPYLQSLTGVKYNKPIWSAFTGPFLGGMGDALNDVTAAALMNSENTQTAERNLAESMYDWLVEPMAQAALTAAPGGPVTGKLASATTIYGVPAGREPFATALTGPDKPGREQPPIQGTLEWIFGGEADTPPSPSSSSSSGRKSGRSAGRSAGRSSGREATR